MKSLILAAAMMIGVVASAQDKRERPEPLKPEQRAELRVKQMDLALDLDDKQQKDLQKLILERTKKAEQFKAERKAKREAGQKPTADERFAMKSKMLDERIAMRDEVKKILTEEQYAKWEKMKREKKGKITKKHKNFKKHSRR